MLYDALVEPATLDVAAGARRFFVGKRAGRPAIRQDAINRLMIREARRGNRIVRLKCGDPFVFGRGGEEALALAAAGIACEVVPGVSSALAAPLLAGIPVTHRGLASAFVVVSGHAEAAYQPVLGSLTPGSATSSFLWDSETWTRFADYMLASGWNARTPTAVLRGASRPGSDQWHGTLDTLTADLHGIESDLPGIIVVGAVAGLAGILSAAQAEPDAFAGGRIASSAT